ncbi:MAG: hypothetical protein RHS_0966 [Robinsoniella sp. RHS]|nr:MAG: hypothetical protein RHS_0966 [Robinsoniella sp. RHS]
MYSLVYSNPEKKILKQHRKTRTSRLHINPQPTIRVFLFHSIWPIYSAEAH